MEHTMHAVFSLAFAAVAARVLTEAQPGLRERWLLLLLAMLVTSARYEGMFLVLAVAMAALLARRWWEMALVPVAGAVPIVLFGLYSLAQGGMFLPNPIAVKSDYSNVHSVTDFLQLMFGRKLEVFLGTTSVLVPVLMALLGVVADAVGKNRLRSADRLFIVIVVLTAGMHLFGARTGWLTRYEAYLVFMSLVAVGVVWGPLLKDLNLKLGAGDHLRAILVGLSVVLLSLVLAAPFLYRMGEGLFTVPFASKNIHDQQVQMAGFVKKYYDGQTIVINDLGAIALYTKARPVDMAGLATLETAQAVVQRHYDTEFLGQLAHDKGAEIAIIYKSWLPKKDRCRLVGSRSGHGRFKTM
jgi:hypothetical protein